MNLTMKMVKKTLSKGKIKLSQHAIDSMDKRGYTKKDICHAIWFGSIFEKQVFQGRLRVVIESVDCDNSPIILVIGYDEHAIMTLITCFPPLKKKFKRVI